MPLLVPQEEEGGYRQYFALYSRNWLDEPTLKGWMAQAPGEEVPHFSVDPNFVIAFKRIEFEGDEVEIPGLPDLVYWVD